MVISKIIEGETESNVVYRLSTAVSYMIPNGTTGFLYTCGAALQTAPCNTSNTSGEIYFCQDTPCTAADSTARWYYLTSAGTSIKYHYPGGATDQAIYTAPKGSIMELRFLPAAVGASANVVEIDVALRLNLSTPNVIKNSRTSSTSGSGASSTFVLLRNHP